MKTPVNAFEPRIDWVTVKGEVSIPRNVGPFEHYYAAILNVLHIPEIDTTIRCNDNNKIIFVDDISKVSFKIEYNRRFKLELSIEFPGEFFVQAHEAFLKAQLISKILSKKLKTELILTRLDVARDIQGRMSDYLPRDLGEIFFNFEAKINEPYRNAKTGEIETLYIKNSGKKKRFVICIYFKSLEIEAKSTIKNEHYGKLFKGEDIVRMETRLFGEQVKKWTRLFYTSENQSAFGQTVLSNFSHKKRAYIGATSSQIKNGNTGRAEQLPIWQFYFNPQKTLNLKEEKFLVNKSTASKKSALRKIERFIVMAENESDFDDIIKIIEKKREELRIKRNERMRTIEKQSALFSEILERL